MQNRYIMTHRWTISRFAQYNISQTIDNIYQATEKKKENQSFYIFPVNVIPATEDIIYNSTTAHIAYIYIYLDHCL